MTYDDVMRLIEHSSPADWVRTILHGQPHWTYRNDVMLHFEDTTQMEYGDTSGSSYEEQWAKQVSDQPAQRALFTIYYGRSLLRNMPMVSVDGGRTLLPIPRSSTELTIAPWDYAFARLVEIFPGDVEHGLDAAMRKAGMKAE